MAEKLNQGEYCFQIEDDTVTAYYESIREDSGGVRYVIKATDNPYKYLGRFASYLEQGTNPPPIPQPVSSFRSKAEVLFNRMTFLNSIDDPEKEVVQLQYTKAVNDYKTASGQPTDVIVTYIGFNSANPLILAIGQQSQVLVATAYMSDGSEQIIPSGEWSLSSERLILEGNRLRCEVAGSYKITASRGGVSYDLNIIITSNG